MTPFQSMLQATTLDSLVGFDRDQALAAGVSSTRANEWALLHRVYFGPTQATKQQNEAVRLARDGHFTLDQLSVIERALKRVRRSRTRMKLRIQLLSKPLRYRALSARVRKLVPKPEKKQEKTVSFSKSVDGLRTVRAVLDERDAADLEFALRQGIDPARPIAPQMLARLIELLRRGGSIARAVPRPIVVVPLPEYTRILAGEGDDVVLGLTDATTMTGAEFLSLQFAESLEVAAFHPQEGPVNLYRGERLANQKQRDLARVATPVCPVPGCRHGSDSCEIHHIEAWSRGGETNVGNLAPLCRYHNRVNDDDPGRSSRGRIANVHGAPVWMSPRGFAVENPYHQFGAMRQLFGRVAVGAGQG